MSGKEEFLRELEERLAVLAESERQDILSEYAQHIDLRMAGGLSEEDAIRDFGDIRLLTAEILEAYHVDPNYGNAPGGGSPRTEEAKPAGGLSRAGETVRKLGSRGARAVRRLGRRTAEAFAGAGRAVGGLIRRIRQGVAAAFRRCRETLGRIVRWRPRRLAEWREKRKERNAMGTNTEKPASGGLAGRLAFGLGRLARGLARIIWNCALLICALPFAAAGLAALVCLGLLLTLLFQGYPLIGAALICLGGLACCCGILGLGWGLAWRRTPREAIPAAGLSTAGQDGTEKINEEEMADNV